MKVSHTSRGELRILLRPAEIDRLEEALIFVARSGEVTNETERFVDELIRRMDENAG